LGQHHHQRAQSDREAAECRHGPPRRDDPGEPPRRQGFQPGRAQRPARAHLGYARPGRRLDASRGGNRARSHALPVRREAPGLQATMIPRRTFLLALSAIVAACSGPLGGGSPPQLYTLTPLREFPPNLSKTTAQLLIEAPSAPGGLDSERIALKKSATSVDYFAGAAWTERAP